MKKIILLYLVLIIILAAVIIYRSGLIKPSSSSLNPGGATATIQNHTFDLMLAKSEEEMITGLSNQDKLDKDKGMLFVFSDSNYYSFWMKNMKFPIDIIFINDNKIVDMYQNVQPPQNNANTSDTKIYKPKEKSNLVLEVPAGTVDLYKFKIGDQVQTKNIE